MPIAAASTQTRDQIEALRGHPGGIAGGRGMHAGVLAGAAAGRQHAGERRDQLGLRAVLARTEAQGQAEVAGPDEQTVEPGHGGDRLAALEAISCLDHGEHHRLLGRGEGVGTGRRAVRIGPWERRPRGG